MCPPGEGTSQDEGTAKTVRLLQTLLTGSQPAQGAGGGAAHGDGFTFTHLSGDMGASEQVQVTSRDLHRREAAPVSMSRAD